MQILEYFQNQRHTSTPFIPRKCQLPPTGNLNLYGPRGSGKTAIIFDYMEETEAEKTLYIDLDDPNLIFTPLLVASLQRHIDAEGITLLILDHYRAGYFETLPKVARLIVLSRTPLHDADLIKVALFPLDYEEFLAFETTTANKSFNHFLRLGTLPAVARSPKSHTEIFKHFFQSAFSESEQKLLLILAQHHTKHLTTHQIYSFAKEKFKVSKDWLYKTIKTFEEEKLLFFIEDRYQKSGKKMLLFDFAFAKYLTLGQPFSIQFDTMIALAFIKHQIAFETLGIHGYLTLSNELVIPAPFESEESLWVKSQNKFSIYKKYGIQKVTIVTIANSYEYQIEKLHFEAIPFNEWSVINAEEELVVSG
jgi:predicted AAA+ superfamily ATPase